MPIVKQMPITDDTLAMDCGVRVMAMLTDLPYEKVAADTPHYRTTSSHDWLRYLNLLGVHEDQVNETAPPAKWGDRNDTKGQDQRSGRHEKPWRDLTSGHST